MRVSAYLDEAESTLFWTNSDESRQGNKPQRLSGGSKSHCKADTDSKTLQQQERRVSFRTRCLLMYKAVSGGLKSAQLWTDTDSKQYLFRNTRYYQV